MLRIGCHLSAANGYFAMGEVARTIGANTFQYFSRNPRGGAVKAFDQGDIDRYLEFAQENGIGQILCHAPYTLNACSADPRIRDFAYRTMAEDISRLEFVPDAMYNFHPGSHVGQGVETGIQQIADQLNGILRPDQNTVVLLETMAGKGSEIGGRFEELREIIDRTNCREKIGVCLDTCHVHDGGYDIVHDLDGVLTEFDRVVGLDKLCALHINDSKNPFESHKDRHETIGNGSLGLETFVNIINHSALKALPFFLETPNELSGYAAEIALLKGLYRG